MRRITQKDVAGKLGVSETVVSYSLNDKPDGFGNVSIRPELRERIIATAKDMGYRVNRSASALTTGRSKTIGIISVQGDNPLLYSRNYETSREILQHGYGYIIQQVGPLDPKGIQQAVDMFLDFHVEGIVSVGANLQKTYSEAQSFTETLGIPVVSHSYGFIGDTEYPCFHSDYYKAEFQMAKKVIREYHKSVCFMIRRRRTKSVSLRIDAIRDACADMKGISVYNYLVPSDLASLSEMECGYQSTIRLLDSKKPDVIFYSNDLFAFGGLKALREQGVRVPKDMMICGFDGIEMVKFSDPPITTAVQPVRAISEKAVEVLFQIIDGKEPDKMEYLIPCEVVFRGSTGH